jgi:predicted amidohydrolase
MDKTGVDQRLKLCVVQLDGIPRARTKRDNLWIPAEPLAGLTESVRPERILPRLSIQRLFAADRKDVYEKIETLSEEATNNRLMEILSFLRCHAVDVAVFPEYSTPITSLPELIEFSRGRAVVAGLEYIRGSKQAEYLAKIAADQRITENAAQRNMSVLVADGRVYFIAKEFHADNETIKSGSGPIVEEVELNGRKVRLGVAVCIDYLRREEVLRDRGAEIVCIPARSSGREIFKPDAPRDYVRLFSNAAAYGGSQVMIPDLGGALVNELGSMPIEPKFEAAVLVAYDQYPKRPSSLVSPNNQLLLRAGIIEDVPSNGVELNAIADLKAYLEEDELPVAQIQRKLTSWLGQIPTESPLGQILEVYREHLALENEDDQIDTLVCSHLKLGPGNGPSAIRQRQAEYIISQLGSLPGDKPTGEARDAYQRLASTADNYDTAHRVIVAMPAEILATESPNCVTTDDDDSQSDIQFADPSNFEPFGADSQVYSVEAEQLLKCRDIEAEAKRVLSATRNLATSASPSDLQVASRTCRLRVAAVADLLIELTGLSPARSDLEWINATGLVTQALAQLESKLPSSHSEARSAMTWSAGREPLIDMAIELHKATVTLRTLAE